jgi:hypothetical protein
MHLRKPTRENICNQINLYRAVNLNRLLSLLSATAFAFVLKGAHNPTPIPSLIDTQARQTSPAAERAKPRDDPGPHLQPPPDRQLASSAAVQSQNALYGVLDGGPTQAVIKGISQLNLSKGVEK